MKGAPLRWAALVALGLVLVAIAVGAPGPGRGGPLDPDGTGPTGARALVLLLGELGADVRVVNGSPPEDAGTALLLRDRLAERDRAATERWIEAGGVLVVADPSSPLAAGVTDRPCPAALDGVDALEVDPDGGAIARDAGFGGQCFGGLVVSDDRGAGTIVGLATPAPLTNELLDDADDAVLAAALLAPTPGTRVAVLDGPSVDASVGDDELIDLVGSPVRQSLVQACIAVALWVLWRGRRLGRPVVEEQPVAIAGSELVVAVGRLLDGRRRPDEAAASLRADLRRAAEGRLGLAPTADLRTVASAIAARTGIDEARAAAALGERPVTTDDDLLAVAADLDRIRTDLFGRPS